MVTNVECLARWAVEFAPTADDLALAQRSLLDTAAVTLAARDHPVAGLVSGLPDAARWASVGHVLDFDDLHVESTTHISVVIVPAVLAAGGDARAYLAGAGAMARLGAALGWSHYAAGWHATCTAGAPAAAVAAGTAMGLSAERLAAAMALAVPGAGGVQAAFGTHGKSLQVGFAADAGVRAARLAAAGATVEPDALDAWLELVGGCGTVDVSGPAVPGGLATKVFPCCYAMQRPIAALREIRNGIDGAVEQVVVRTPKTSMQPLIHDRPRTGLEGKFSLPYAVATAVLDAYPDFTAFTDAGVNRPQVQRLLDRVEVQLQDARGDDLLAGEVDIDVRCASGSHLHTRMAQPPGSPSRPPSHAELDDKLTACGADIPDLLAEASWDSVRELLRAGFPQLQKGL